MLTPEAFAAAFPKNGLFAEKDWLLSPEPFPLEPKLAEEISGLGHRLRVFLKACNALYHRSVKGKLPPWIASAVDAGKPASLLEIARAPALREELPRVIRPDLLLTADGLALTEIDSVPGGIGLTAWLNETYAASGAEVIGGPRGMIDGFGSLFPRGADLLVSQEAGSYRPEMQWLAEKLGPAFSVASAEDYTARDRDVYRFFELFDLPNLPAAPALLAEVAAGRLRMTASPKPWLEEKAWLALFHLRPLLETWRRELTDNQLHRLQKIIPYSWLVDPAPLPHHAVLPRLEIQSWDELAAFSQKQRQLVLKLSGFSELAWGSRSVTIGHDVSQHEWAAAVAEAQKSFATNPFVLQEFRPARVVEHPYYDRETGLLRTLRGRVRLCPYFFASAADDSLTLGGILATICPEDKKIIHGMKDAILVPCCVSAYGA